MADRCHIVDIAGNKRLNRMVDAFIQIEILDVSNGFGRFQEKILDESGLSEESPATILEMKSIIAEYRTWKEKQGSTKKR